MGKMKHPVITLLTDFGTADHYVAAMKGVILSICPNAELVDISHEITPYAIPEGAFTLAQAWQCFPKGTIHLAVVDPGVGSSRRAIAAETSGHYFLAPDNGLLSMVLAGGHNTKIREISAKQYFRQPVSRTFHGRDIFAPVAAHLASGLPINKLGKTIDDPVSGTFAEPVQIAEGAWSGTVLKIDRFGNAITNLERDTFRGIANRPFRLELGRRAVTRFCATYAGAPKNQPFAIFGSSGYVEISLNQSNAAHALRVASGSAIRLVL
jgi:S-adenosylmethionine hydrolase